MTIHENSLYMDDVRAVAALRLPWEKLRNSGILISGATGLIGSLLIDVIMEKNRKEDLGCTVYAVSRNPEKAQMRFGSYAEDPHFIHIAHDVNLPFTGCGTIAAGYVLHLASNTHPLQYSRDPVGTITTNLIGLKNMLDLAAELHAVRFVFASSNEIYGENRGDVEFFSEDYCGYIDSNTMRAGYPESKRCGEALCQAYRVQKGLDVVIPRVTRTYGPTMQMSDTKAVSQFIRKGIAGEDIVLKSAGNQYYSYQYAADSVSGILTVMLAGKDGEAYNIADESSDIRLKDLAELIAAMSGKKVVYEIPDAAEAAGYSTATKARLCGNKLKKLGWEPRYTIGEGIKRTITILRQLGE